jgi:tRNA (guanine9-N1)-methyltransferase
MVQTAQELHPSPDPNAYNLPPSDSDRTTAATLSKKAQKKALKAERYAAQKLGRRAREKEAKKEKRRVLAEKRAAGELEENDDVERNGRKRARVGGNAFGGRVILDLGFDSMMREKVGLVHRVEHPMQHATHVSRKSHHSARS